MEYRPLITFPTSCEPRGSCACLDTNIITPKCEYEDPVFPSPIYAPSVDIKPDISYHSCTVEEQFTRLKMSPFSDASYEADPLAKDLPDMTLHEGLPRFTSGDHVIVLITTRGQTRWVHGEIANLASFREWPTEEGGVAYPVKYRDGATVIRRFDPDKGEIFRDPFSTDPDL
ncbi:uncharacterized protein TRAVEDRAFT_42619 [Trametes versicolor FP-101664 SS1]|uniref:uncharacterized protein n=1 Tax=Trametes versicolor (strain FP-101664) TaxID=717944 RepID=UPI0004622481|nr:uncharacterized protein TRAVEDRAFT_42619 [Trametes versicolor FP-101664 SS1]EIW65240.1 hypothetical protein TRAVEDRAFT_42619 [Trametes versicolor FP-101664 SS1]